MDQGPLRLASAFQALRRWVRPVRDRRRVVEVGWYITPGKASLIWPDPRPFARKQPRPASSKSVQLCPAAIDFDSRHVVVDCPVDLRLGMRMDDPAGPRIANLDGAESTVRTKHLGQMISLVARNEWRHPDRPILQITTPYIFMADEPVYLNQLPPYLDYTDPAWPGLLIGGRFPIDVWPRQLMWAFEWHDTSKELVLRRGRPWFYVRFETEGPTSPFRLVECDPDAAAKAYIESLTGVTNYVDRTFSLFERARQRRPAQLLRKKS